MKKCMKQLLLLVLTVLFASLVSCSKQGGDTGGDDWPNKNIKIIVPFKAGGDTDFHARTYAKYLTEKLGQNIVVFNVNGANGSAGTIQVKDAKPDGYTALFFHDSMLMNKVVGVTDFAHEVLDVCAAGVLDNTYILAVNAKSPYQNLNDLIEAAKKEPGKLTYASSVGGYTYYVGCLLEKIAGVSFNKVDAGGGADRNAALLANKITTNVNPYGVMKPYIDSGDFRVLAVFSENRSKLFPDIPTAKEQGIDLVAGRKYFLSFPKGTPASVIEKMSKAMEEISQNPEYQKEIATAYGVDAGFMGTEEINAYLDKSIEQFMADKDLILGN